MRRYRKLICCILAAVLLAQGLGIPALAAQEDMVFEESVLELIEEAEEEILEELQEEVPAPEEDLTEETEPAEQAEAPEETTPKETVPKETVPKETAPVEMQPAPTLPQGTEESAREVYGEVPLYFQTDFPNTRYGNGTVETSGCSITCLAMVATYLTGHEYMPDELARWFGGRAENNMARMEYGCEQLQIPFQKSYNWHEVKQALEDGQIAIVLVNSKSIFTESQHFIVLTGLTEDQLVLVNDPYAPNYEHWSLKQGFETGFTEYEITNGFSGAWLFDPFAMPADPFIYVEEEPEEEEYRYQGIELSDAELELLAKVVWAEARGECFEGQQAVAEVVLNRLVSERFADTIHDVVFGEGQFRTVNVLSKAEPYQTQYQAIEAALYGPYVLPMDVVYFATWTTNDNIWGQIGNHIFCYQE